MRAQRQLRSVEPLDSPAEGYDLLIGTHGFEQRSSFIPLALADLARAKWAPGFPDRHVLSHHDNDVSLRQAGFHRPELSDDSYQLWLVGELQRLVRQSSSPRIAVDISSMSRTRIAQTSECLARADEGPLIRADFLYAPAKYSSPGALDAPIVSRGPVTEYFAGWSSRPDLVVALVLGLGYERDRAIGVMEYLEPGVAVAFVATAEDGRYLKALKKANDALWDTKPNPLEIQYDLARPFDCFARLNSLADGLAGSYRPIIVPFGPKLFALVALLVAVANYPRVGVWRFSAGSYDQAVQRVASGRVVGLKTTWAGSEEPPL